MKKLTILLMTALTVTTWITACATRTNDVAGTMVADREVKNYALSDFSRVEARGTVRVFIAQGDRYGISVKESANPNLLTVVEKQGQTLLVYTKSLKKNVSLRGDKDMPEVYMTVPGLSSVKCSGASTVSIDKMNTDGFDATVSGASTLKMAMLKGKAVNLSCSGASSIMAQTIACTSMRSQLTGASKLKAKVEGAGDLKIDCSGASKQELSLKGRSLAVANSGASKSIIEFSGSSVDARNSGAGKLELDVDCEFLKASNSGASKFVITGTADRTDIDLSGASKIDTKGLNQY